MGAWRRERPDVDVSSIGIVMPVARLASLLAESRASVLAGHELDQSHLDVLGVLRRSGPPYRLTAGELSRRCRVTPGATTHGSRPWSAPVSSSGSVRIRTGARCTCS